MAWVRYTGVFLDDCRPAEKSCIKNNSVVSRVVQVHRSSDLSVLGAGASKQSATVSSNRMARVARVRYTGMFLDDCRSAAKSCIKNHSAAS